MFLLNELSMDGQYATDGEVRAAVDAVMSLRRPIQEAGWQVRVPRIIGECRATRGNTLRSVVRSAPDRTWKRGVLLWIDRSGPFVDDDGPGGADEFVEFVAADGARELVAGSALAEAARRVGLGQDARTVSFAPHPKYNDSSLALCWVHADDDREDLRVLNYWTLQAVLDCLVTVAKPFRGWSDLEDRARRGFPQLAFPDNAFCVRDLPFSRAAAERIWWLLDVLARMKAELRADGALSDRWRQFHRNYFEGKRAAFTDSSDPEKREFRSLLTFRHPERSGETLFCPWHGKISHMTLRLHFTWPMRNGEPLFVVYVGPKLTKR